MATFLIKSSGRPKAHATTDTLQVANLTGTVVTASTNLTLATGATVTGIDNGDLATGSATLLATQGAIKTYVDAQVSSINIDGYDAYTGTLHQTEDVFLFSDGGTEKKVDFSTLEDSIFASVSGDIAIAAGGGATIQANSVALATDTTGDYVQNITAGTGLTSTGATSGENIAHSLSVDAAQTQITSIGTIATGTWAATDVAVTHGGTGSSTASGARTNLGLAIGSDVQAYDAQLADVAGLAVTDGGFIVGDGSNFVLESGNTARGSLGLGTGDSPTFTGLTLSGNLEVQGTTTTLTSTTLSTGDAMFSMGTGQTGTDTDALDFGFYGTYDEGDTQKYRGVFIDQSDSNTLCVFNGLQAEPSTTVNTGGTGYALAPMKCSNLTATNVAGTITTGAQNSITSATSLAAVGTITTGVWTGTTIAVANGGTGATSASAARTALGVAIGSDVQAYDAQLADVAGLAVTDGGFIVGNGSNFVLETGATARTSLGLVIGTDVQAFDADLTNLAGCQAGASAALAALTSTQVAILDDATVTTTELNKLSGVTATTAELNYVDVTTLGTAEASKALTASASNACNIDAIDMQLAADSKDRGFYDGTVRFSYSAFRKNWAGAATYTNAEAISADNIVAINSSGQIVKADCSVEAEYDSIIGVAVATVSATPAAGQEVVSAYGAIVINGTEVTLDEGEAVYLSTAGTITNVLPTTTDHAVIKLGVCTKAGGIGTGEFMWCPQFLYVN